MIITVDKDGKIISTTKKEGLNYEYKIVDKLPEDIETHNYRYSMGNFIDLGIKEEHREKTFEELKEIKLQELETFIYNLKEQGFYYNENRFKLDSVAQNRINMLATNVSLTNGDGIFPLQWFTANGENGTITLENTEDFSGWYTQATMKILEIEQKEATYRYMVEQAQTEEELNNIIFE